MIHLDENVWTRIRKFDDLKIGDSNFDNRRWGVYFETFIRSILQLNPRNSRNPRL